MSSLTVTIKEEVERAIESTGFSGVISVKQKGKQLYLGASGYADRSNRIENSLTTRFAIAAGVKLLTSLAIGMLFEEGRLSFTSRIFDLLDCDLPYSKEITVGQLLTHTSGIPDYFDVGKVEDFNNFFVGRPWYELEGPSDYLSILPHKPMLFKPGSSFRYSNSGYILLGVLIEKISKMRYRDYITERLLKPLGMTGSGFFARNDLPPDTAIGYIDERDGHRTNTFNVPIIGASDNGLYSTLEDIDRLWEGFYNCEILAKELVDLYISPLTKAPMEGDKIYHGHGLWIYKESETRQSEYVCGCLAGVSFASSVDRVGGVYITVMSNTTGGAWPIMDVINDFF